MTTETEKINYIPCVFVNSLPQKYGPIRGFSVEKKDGLRPEFVLSIFRDVHYEHPEAPHDAVLVVTESHTVMRAKEGDRYYSQLALIKAAQDVAERMTPNE